MRAMQVRSEYRGENQSEAIWTFRIERYDNAGNRTLLLPVEMRGRTFEGSISDGDWVRARGRMHSGTLRVSLLENLSTGAHVRAKGISKAAYIAAITIFVLFVVALIIWTIVDSGSSGGPPPDFPEP
ncbi:hypothetical protein ABZ471_31595 [Streptomyces sp. NPDC005728]|uniref:hypothetical protein n=1 Tax=Streptomyces sp. NPDC005728 TaxID=3157054 RepID=UPI0033D383D1